MKRNVNIMKRIVNIIMKIVKVKMNVMMLYVLDAVGKGIMRIRVMLQASSFTCGNKKTGLSKTIGVKKQQTKHAC